MSDPDNRIASTCRACGKSFSWPGGIVDQTACPHCGNPPSPRSVLRAMAAELDSMEAISKHTRLAGTHEGTTLLISVHETGWRLRVLIALYPKRDPRARPIKIDVNRDGGFGVGFEPWLEAAWEGPRGKRLGRLVKIRDCHGDEPEDADSVEALRVLTERLRGGLEAEDPEEE